MNSMWLNKAITKYNRNTILKGWEVPGKTLKVTSQDGCKDATFLKHI